jgi:hypothetical protein
MQTEKGSGRSQRWKKGELFSPLHDVLLPLLQKIAFSNIPFPVPCCDPGQNNWLPAWVTFIVDVDDAANDLSRSMCKVYKEKTNDNYHFKALGDTSPVPNDWEVPSNFGAEGEKGQYTTWGLDAMRYFGDCKGPWGSLTFVNTYYRLKLPYSGKASEKYLDGTWAGDIGAMEQPSGHEVRTGVFIVDGLFDNSNR